MQDLIEKFKKIEDKFLRTNGSDVADVLHAFIETTLWFSQRVATLEKRISQLEARGTTEKK